MAKTRVFPPTPSLTKPESSSTANVTPKLAKPERPSRDEIATRIKDKDGLVMFADGPSQRGLASRRAKAPHRRQLAVGYDNLDIPACTKRGVIATNTPGVLDETNCRFCLDFAYGRCSPPCRRRHLRSHRQLKGWNLDQMCGTDVWGKTLGIVGFAASVELSPAARRALKCASSIRPQSALPSKLKKNSARSIAT